MNYDSTMPEMANVNKAKTLLDKTVISTVEIKDKDIYSLVVDEGVDTALFFNFDKKEDIESATKIQAITAEEYLDQLFELYPNLKGWIPDLPYGEPGDCLHIRLMNGDEFITGDIKWIHEDDKTFSFIPYPGGEKISMDQVRYIHIYYGQETFTSLSDFLPDVEPDLEMTRLMTQMINVHMEKFRQRQLAKTIKQITR